MSILTTIKYKRPKRGFSLNRKYFHRELRKCKEYLHTLIDKLNIDIKTTFHKKLLSHTVNS